MSKRREELNYKVLECFAIIASEHFEEILGKARMANLLYIAHRQCIKESNHLLLDNQILITKYGLAHTAVMEYLGLLDMCHINSNIFFEHFKTIGHQIRLVKAPKPKCLSKYTTSLLREVSRKFIYADDIDVFDEVRSYPEYNKFYEINKLDTECLLKDINPERADEIYQELLRSRELYKVFNNINIMINGKEYDAEKEILTYREIVDLSKISTKYPTITFTRRRTIDSAAENGILQSESNIKLTHGMIFSVADTSNA